MSNEAPYASLCNLPKGGAVGKLLRQWGLPNSGRHVSVMNRINSAPPVLGVKVFLTQGKWEGTRGQFLQSSDIRNLANACFQNEKDKTDAQEALRAAFTLDSTAWSKKLREVMCSTESPIELAYAVMLQTGYKDLSAMLENLHAQGSNVGIGLYKTRCKIALERGWGILPELRDPLLALIPDEAKPNATALLSRERPQGHVAVLEAEVPPAPSGRTGR